MAQVWKSCEWVTAQIWIHYEWVMSHIWIWLLLKCTSGALRWWHKYECSMDESWRKYECVMAPCEWGINESCHRYKWALFVCTTRVEAVAQIWRVANESLHKFESVMNEPCHAYEHGFQRNGKSGSRWWQRCEWGKNESWRKYECVMN